MQGNTNNHQRYSKLSICAAFLTLASLVANANGDVATLDGGGTNYTCDPLIDYNENLEICPKTNIQNGKCDNPNHVGGEDELCAGQDCIDCNYWCGQFKADCFGCLNAVGCYYCPGDATCQNSNLYQSNDKVLSCTKKDDFWLGGEDDPDLLCISPDATTEDPLSLTNEWMYNMINVVPVWKDLKYTGSGITIRINDYGVDIDNEDLNAPGKFDLAGSCSVWQPPSDTTIPKRDHGTRVAGVVSASANNRFCATGIAYDSSFSSCNVFDPSIQLSLNFDFKLDTFDISLNSVGFPACQEGEDAGKRDLQDACPFPNVPANTFRSPCDECDFSQTPDANCEDAIFNYCKRNFRRDEEGCTLYFEATIGRGTGLGGSCNYDKFLQQGSEGLMNGANNGRNGLGAIYVVAAGNFFYGGEDTGMSGFLNSRYTIPVGAVGKDGLHTDYSTPGTNVFVSAPVGDYNDASRLITTGIGGICRESGTGTSYAAPIVAGVIALILEARPELTWRDVQHVIASSSKRVNDGRDEFDQTNAAGFWHSNLYGFGIIDAKKAVETALTWNLVTPEYEALGASAQENQPIPTDGGIFTSEITLGPEYSGFFTESTSVLITLSHYKRGDLEVTLISPQGTKSVLHPGRRPEELNQDGAKQWSLMTVRNWGEDPTGVWKLEIKDLVTSNEGDANEFRNWNLVLHGQTEDGNPVVLPTSIPTSTPTVAPSLTPTVADTAAPSTVPSIVPTIETGGGGIGGEETPSPTIEEPGGEETPSPTIEEPGAEVPTDETAEPTADNGITAIPTITPTNAPVVPTLKPTTGPTPLPTLTPGSKSLPPLEYVRPTVITGPKGSALSKAMNSAWNVVLNQQGVGNSGGDNSGGGGDNTGADNTGTDDTGVVNTGVDDLNPSVSPGDSDSSTGTVMSGVSRPTVILPKRTQSSSLFNGRIRSFNAEDETEEKYLSVELVKDLSLELEGISDVPESCWPSLQTALEEHSMTVVGMVLPSLHFKSQVRMVSVESNNDEGSNRQRRSLRLDKGRSSCTIGFYELVEFDHKLGTEQLKGATLAALPFKNSHDRDAFIAKLQNEVTCLDAIKESLVSVSALELPPTEPPVMMPTQVPVLLEPTALDGSSKNSNSNKVSEGELEATRAGVNSDTEKSTVAASAAEKQKPPASTAAIVSWSVVGAAALLCGTVFIVLRRRSQ